MQFSVLAVSFLAAFVAASPMPKKSAKSTSVDSCASAAATDSAASSTVAAAASATGSSSKAASTAAAAASGGDVLTASAYNDFQISSGTAGDAEANANALFAGIDQTNLAAVSANDLDVINGIHDAAEDAEVSAFNPAIAAATGDEADALQRGKIANKVLKLTAEVLGLQVKVAQGGSGDVAAEQTKLAKNIATDKADAGLAQTAVPFDATS